MADTIGDRYLVVLFLDGGNDGLNTVIPVERRRYARPTTRTRAGASGGGMRRRASRWCPAHADPRPATPATQLGFHPGLGGAERPLRPGQGRRHPGLRLSRVQPVARGVARHLAERRIRSSTPAAPAGSAATSPPPATPAATSPAVNIGGEVARRVHPDRRPACSPSTACRTSASRTTSTSTTTTTPTTRRSRTPSSTRCTAPPAPARIRRCSTSAAPASRRCSPPSAYPQLHDDYETDRPTLDDQYDSDQDGALNTSTARDLREIAKIIYGVERGVPNVNARFFELANGGYDTHSDQGGGEPAAALPTCTTRSATRSSSSTTTSPTWLRRDGGLGAGESRQQGGHRRVERVQPPHPAERQRHRPRLAGPDVRHRRRGHRRRLRQPSEHRRVRARRRRQHASTRRTPATAPARPTSATSTARS